MDAKDKADILGAIHRLDERVSKMDDRLSQIERDVVEVKATVQLLASTLLAPSERPRLTSSGSSASGSHAAVLPMAAKPDQG